MNAVGMLSGRAVVVSQQPAEALATLNAAFSVNDFLTRFDELVVEPLVIWFRAPGSARQRIWQPQQRG